MIITTKETAEYLLENDNYLLYCHRDPDGDTFGSASALCSALLSLGKKARITCPSVLPSNLEFLNGPEYNFTVAPAPFKPTGELLVGIDTAAPNMFGDMAVRPQKIDLVIDHHPTNSDYASFTRLVNYAATGEVIYEIINEMKVTITPTIATSLYTALSSDTGGFNFANTTSQTHFYAAKLMDLGADYHEVRRQLYESNSKGRVKVESKALSNTEYILDDKIAIIEVTLKDTLENNIDENELEGLASVPLKTKGVHVAITLKERDDGSIRISMRSDDDKYDVSKICSLFQGGGHIRASGCRIYGTLKEAKQKVIEACKKEFF